MRLSIFGSDSADRPEAPHSSLRRERWSGGPAALIVAEATDAKLVGSLIVGWDGWRCHMYRLVVEPGRRRAGIAGMLVAEAQRRARALGAERIDAMVHRDNVEAVAFSEANGFEPQDNDERWSLAF